jgi:mercuric ion binding protein
MRKRKMSIIALILFPLAVLAAVPQTVKLTVRNMTCPLCPITVRKSLEKVPGVQTVKVNFDTKTATVTYDPDKTRPAALTRATTDAGYPSKVESKEPSHVTR